MGDFTIKRPRDRTSIDLTLMAGRERLAMTGTNAHRPARRRRRSWLSRLWRNLVPARVAAPNRQDGR
jgi:hypothetical protein